MRLIFFRILILALSCPAYAASLADGLKLYQRLAGTPPSKTDLGRIETLASANDLEGIANLAMGTRGFLSGTVKMMASPLTNVSQDPVTDLNDVSATIIGMVRDNVPLNQMLFEDIVYVGELPTLAMRGLNVPAYRDDNNNHHRELDTLGVDLTDSALFVRKSQSAMNILGPDATMGVMTLRASGEAFMRDGTNRRMIRFAMVNFFCKDMEQLHDNTISDYRVRQDVPRNAGGDSSTYINTCSGCHAGMDGLAGAFAKYDFVATRDAAGNVNSDRRVNNTLTVVSKYYRNAHEYPEGYYSRGDDWVNLWTEGQNSALGWRPGVGGQDILAGNGAKSLGKVFAAARGFSECMAKRAYAQVCSRKAPYAPAEEQKFASIADRFEASDYSGKVLFSNAALSCGGTP